MPHADSGLVDSNVAAVAALRPGQRPPHRQAREAKRQWQLGQAHAAAQRWEAALGAHRQATRLAPHDAVYAINHARALMARGHLRRAGDEAQRAFALDPSLLPARGLAVDCLLRQNRAADAAALLDSVGPADAHDADFHAQRGNLLQRLGRPLDAVSALFDALALRPGEAQLHHNLGLCFSDLQRDEEAAHCYNTALLLGVGPHEVGTRGLACFAERVACTWNESDAHLAALHDAVLAMPDNAHVPAAPFAHAVLSTDRKEQLLAARACARFLAGGIQPLPPRPAMQTGDTGRVDDNDSNAASGSTWQPWRPGSRRLRLGYVSCDFHGHATAILMADMLERHDRTRFEVTLYSHGPDDGSAMRRRVEAACTHFVDIRTLSDHQAAERIRNDGIDVLVDLKGHTRDNRLSLFAYRAAPVQVGFLGFPGSSGADYLDYVVGDPVVTPLAHAADYSEKIAQLPLCYQPNDRHRRLPSPPTRASQGLPAEAVVLCGFNQPYKISPRVLDSWCRLLRDVPGSVLWLLDWTPQALPRLRAQAEARGVDPARLVGAPRVDADCHIARLQLADIFVDTWPCNAHTTASDALWAGVPIVTLMGETFASRVAASLLRASGTPELVCQDPVTYEATVLALARDPARRVALRQHLSHQREFGPLFDSSRYTLEIEALYLRMALRHAQGLPPAPLVAANDATAATAANVPKTR